MRAILNAATSGETGGGLSPTPTDTAYGFQGETPVEVYKSTGVLRLKWSTDMLSDPGVGEVTGDSHDFATLTELRINKTTDTNADLTYILSALVDGNIMFISVDQKSDAFIGLVVSGLPVDKGDYFEIPITVETVGNSAGDGEYLLFNVMATSLVSKLAVNNTNGYQTVVDSSTKTVGYITAHDGVQTQITNDALAGNNSNLPSNVTEFVQLPNGRAVMDQAHGIYSLGVKFWAEPTTRDKDYVIEWYADTGAGLVKISGRSQRFSKQIQDEEISMSFTVPCVPFLVGLPISVYITTDSTDVIIWGQSLSVTKNNAPLL